MFRGRYRYSLEDGAERLLDAAERLWAIGYGRGTIAALVALGGLGGRGELEYIRDNKQKRRISRWESQSAPQNATSVIGDPAEQDR